MNKLEMSETACRLNIKDGRRAVGAVITFNRMYGMHSSGEPNTAAEYLLHASRKVESFTEKLHEETDIKKRELAHIMHGFAPLTMKVAAAIEKVVGKEHFDVDRLHANDEGIAVGLKW